MQVLKFGGTSVADALSIKQVLEIVKKSSARDKTIVVASALSGVTDALLEIGDRAGRGDETYLQAISDLEKRHRLLVKDLIPKDFQNEITTILGLLFEKLRDVCRGACLIREISRSTRDLIAGFGELLSTRILEAKCNSMGMSCKWIDARQIIQTETASHRALVNVNTAVTFKNIRDMLQNNPAKILILPGFIASDPDGRTTTLGRGGSDYTASLLAVGGKARMLWIWTDVNGMMTADPGIVADARTIEHISYKEALEISHFGAKVVYPPTIQPVVAKGIPIMVKNTFDPDGPGTLIEGNPPEGHDKIRGISGSNRIALLSMEGSGMVGIPGYSSRLFNTLTQQQINIILITQASSVHTMLVAIDEKDAEKARRAADETFAYEISLQKVEPLKVESGYSIISLIGDDMKNQSGASGRMFEAIGKRNITIRAIAQGSSEKNVSAVVSTSHVKEAIAAVHEEFFESPKRHINLFIAGWGNVGKSLTQMISDQKDALIREENTILHIAGICNSKKMAFQKEGNSSFDIYEALSKSGMINSNGSFPDTMIEMNLRNSVFVDCTSDHYLAARYADILEAGIAVVTCNKIANSLDMDYYKRLRCASRRENTPFLYETNVGAALPVISLIRQMRRSGDTPHKIEACLSGTLNYVFGKYDGSVPFHEIVEEASRQGYTEPDPMTDLSGTDVLRKALILARECGLAVEEGEIETLPFIPAEWPNEAHFKNLLHKSLDSGSKLRYVARIENGIIQTGLEQVPASHPFNALGGTNSSIILYSRLYPDGLRIEGAGAGATQTASGLLNDILQTQ